MDQDGAAWILQRIDTQGLKVPWLDSLNKALTVQPWAQELLYTGISLHQSVVLVVFVAAL